jgi:hypothetical protein
MTSWIRVPFKRSEEEKSRPYFVSLGQDEFCTHFNTLFYSQLYAKSMSKELIIYDKSTAISPSYALLEETFAPISGVSYSSEMRPMVTVLRPKDGAKFFPLLSSLSIQELRTQANMALVWNSEMLKKIREVFAISSFPENFDVGIHIRVQKKFDTIRAPTPQNYVDAVKAVITKENPTVFVMVDEPMQLEEFKRIVPVTWVVHNVYSQNSLVRGSAIATFGRQSVATKISAYIDFLTELYCMQHSSKLICNLSNDIGRFLFLTGGADNFRSMDTPEWRPF